MHGVQHLARVLPAAHQDDALDAADSDRLVVDGEDAGLRHGADPHPADVADEERHALGRVEHDLLDVLDRSDEAGAADRQRLLAHVEQGAPGVAIVALHGVGELAHAQPILVERSRIDLDLVLPHLTPEGDHVRDAGNLKQPGREDPVLDLAQTHRIVAVAAKGVAIHLADPRRQRAERRGDAVRQCGVAEALENQLAREVIVGAIREGQLDDRETEDRPRTARDHVRRVVERALDRHRDLLLHLLGGESRQRSDHDDTRIRDVRVGLELELTESPDAGDDEDQCGRDDRPTAGQRELQETTQHGGTISAVLQEHATVDDDAVAGLHPREDGQDVTRSRARL